MLLARATTTCVSLIFIHIISVSFDLTQNALVLGVNNDIEVSICGCWAVVFLGFECFGFVRLELVHEVMKFVKIEFKIQSKIFVSLKEAILLVISKATIAIASHFVSLM